MDTPGSIFNAITDLVTLSVRLRSARKRQTHLIAGYRMYIPRSANIKIKATIHRFRFRCSMVSNVMSYAKAMIEAPCYIEAFVASQVGDLATSYVRNITQFSKFLGKRRQKLMSQVGLDV